MTKKELTEKHGTLAAFTEACVNAIGGISKTEALDAIDRYREQWEAAEDVRLTFSIGSDEYHVLRLLSNDQITVSKARELLREIQQGQTVTLLPLEVDDE